MQLRYGIEATTLVEHEWLRRLSIKLIDYDQQIYVVNTEEDANLLQQSLLYEGIFEEKHLLVALEMSLNSPAFADYGFVSQSNQSYLLAELVCAFSITSGSIQDIEMASYQIEEHLIATETWKNQSYYFVDHNEKELIQGFADAYNIGVTFFNLDK